MQTTQTTQIKPIPRTDIRHDLSLRLLATFVAGALVISLVYFLAGILRPSMLDTRQWDRTNVRMPLATDEPTKPAAREAHGLTIYRCDQAGKTTYSDRPCGAGVSRTLRLPPT
jgi:hypothetical protein